MKERRKGWCDIMRLCCYSYSGAEMFIHSFHHIHCPCLYHCKPPFYLIEEPPPALGDLDEFLHDVSTGRITFECTFPRRQETHHTRPRSITVGAIGGDPSGGCIPTRARGAGGTRGTRGTKGGREEGGAGRAGRGEREGWRGHETRDTRDEG